MDEDQIVENLFSKFIDAYLKWVLSVSNSHQERVKKLSMERKNCQLNSTLNSNRIVEESSIWRCKLLKSERVLPNKKASDQSTIIISENKIN